jgi:hypothetical protein
VKRLALALILLPIAAVAQLQLYVAPQGGQEQPISTSYDIGTGYIGDVVALRFRIRNVGSATVSLNQLRVSGTGFSMKGNPSLPHQVAPGTNVDFTINFKPLDQGIVTATLQINSAGISLTASGLASAAFLLDGEPLQAGSTVDFGRMERGLESVRRIELRNTTAGVVTVRSVALNGNGFSLVDQSTGARDIQPSASLQIPVRFSPPAAQIFTGTLVVDGTRTIQLTGTGVEPQMPRPRLVLETPVLRSGQQGRISVRLESVSRAIGKGELRMQVLPAAAGSVENDRAAQFLTGGRSVAFDVNEGSDAGRFASTGDATITFQTGTTSGTIVFTLQAGGFSDQLSVVIDPEPVRIDSTSVKRTGSTIDVDIAGFDNARTAGAITFTFYTASGQAIPVTADATNDFKSWWANSTLGGIFSHRAAFPVTGDATQIRSVEVEFVNSAGRSKTDRLSF